MSKGRRATTRTPDNRAAPDWLARQRACRGQAGAARFVCGQIEQETHLSRPSPHPKPRAQSQQKEKQQQQSNNGLYYGIDFQHSRHMLELQHIFRTFRYTCLAIDPRPYCENPRESVGMTEVLSDIFTFFGLLLTLIGALITARAVILKEDDAIDIGLSRFSSENRDENLSLPMVQNLLASSRGARRGLIVIMIGTALQLIPIAFRLAAIFVA
ncbi:hypothetical protein [Cypionkella sp.]|uniref:hypothetical protein n=1 Tax=Cypionkella sp. TaxID=2811411 RepID=UPI002AB8E0B0|nr:hypothetical protein [Cypionkella sp.]MDZ4391987.1 hypothetical protein [Cypionkella sp.]